MIGVGTIRFRLTAAYALLLTVMVGGTAVWSWIAARQSLAVTVDRSLERDMALFQTSVGQVLHWESDIVKAIQMSTTCRRARPPGARFRCQRRLGVSVDEPGKPSQDTAARCRTRPSHVSHRVGDRRRERAVGRYGDRHSETTDMWRSWSSL